MQSLDMPRVMLFLATVSCCSIGIGGLLLLALWRTRLAPRVGCRGGERRPRRPQQYEPPSRYRETLRDVQAHPGGWLVADTLASHIAFALAMDEGAGGDLLAGFYEFLVARIGVDTSWWWPGLTLWLTDPVGPKGRGIGHLPEDLNHAAIKRWYELLDEHLSSRAAEQQSAASKPTGLPDV